MVPSQHPSDPYTTTVCSPAAKSYSKLKTSPEAQLPAHHKSSVLAN